MFSKIFGKDLEAKVEPEVEVKTLSEEDQKLIKAINRTNRRPIAEDILLGELSDEELYEKYDFYSVEEMKREIAKLQGNPWVCRTCR